MSGWILAVDFGTVNTGAAIRFADTRVEKVKLDPNSDTMPSAVVVTEGRWRVGQAALNARRTHPDTFIGSPKARLGQEPVALGDDMVSPAAIASHVLAAVRERAIRTAGGSAPDRLVLTHPVRWGRARLGALQEAAQSAGFAPDTIRLLPEPIAALHAHVPPGSLPPGSRVAVVDTGGGTCDVAVLQTTDDPAPGKDLLVVAQEGDDRLGGNDLDDLLYQWVLSQLRASGRQDMAAALADPEHLGAALTLLDVVRSAKQDLSEHTNAPIGVAVAGHETTLTVTREEYEDLIAEPMARAGALTARALQASGTGSLAGLYLTGGTAYTPALAQALHKVTGILTAPLGDPKLAVAVGALKTPVAVMTPAQLAALAHQLTQQRQQQQPPPPPSSPPRPAPTQAQPPTHTPPPTQPTQPRQAASGPPRITPPPTPPPDRSGYTSTAPGYAASTPPPPTAPTTPGYRPGPGPGAPSYAHGPGYPAPRPTGPTRPAQAPIGTRPSPGNGPKIALGVAVGLLALAVVGLGTWWFAFRDDGGGGGGGGVATTSPPEQTCWDGTTTTGDCPAFEGTAAALYAFKPKAGVDTSTCEPYSAYTPRGWTEATICSTGDGGVYISQWPTPQRAVTAFKGANYEDNGQWRNKDGDEMGPWLVYDFGAQDADYTDSYLHVYCYADAPFCIEGVGTVDNATSATANFGVMTSSEAQALRDYLDSH
ncbi:MAG: Hsp70 family protein [Micrococcales bacterium]|nr:Hsp70 family protein [Micrococcales bacterium]